MGSADTTQGSFSVPENAAYEDGILALSKSKFGSLKNHYRDTSKNNRFLREAVAELQSGYPPSEGDTKIYGSGVLSAKQVYDCVIDKYVKELDSDNDEVNLEDIAELYEVPSTKAIGHVFGAFVDADLASVHSKQNDTNKYNLSEIPKKEDSILETIEYRATQDR